MTGEGAPCARADPNVRRFYALAGGAVLHAGAEYEITILAPDAVVPANPVLVGEPGEGDRSAAWYLVARDGGRDYLTVDFAPARLGWCYDSHHETHGLVGQTPVIARSFAELLHRLHGARGERPYWLEADWVPLGDAYDDEPVTPAPRVP